MDFLLRNSAWHRARQAQGLRPPPRCFGPSGGPYLCAAPFQRRRDGERRLTALRAILPPLRERRTGNKENRRRQSS